MKLRRLVKIPRSARTIELVINLPTPINPTPAPAPKPPKPTAWSRVWIFLKTAGPALAATAALIISILALVEQKSADRAQQQANAAAAAASQRQQAAQVSYLNVISLASAINIALLVENLGTIPAYSPSFIIQVSGLFQVKERGPIFAIIPQTFNVDMNSIPACSSGTVNLSSAILYAMQANKITVSMASGIRRSLSPTQQEIDISSPELVVTVQGMIFSDGNGLNWKYSIEGGLNPVSFPSKTTLDSGYAQVTYKAASGCT